MSGEPPDEESLLEAEPPEADCSSTAEPPEADCSSTAELREADCSSTAEPPRARRPRPTGARCDACHERGARVVRSRDGLLTVCTRCARAAEVVSNDSAEAIAAVVNRAPLTERRQLMRRLLARRALHTARRDRKTRPT